LIHETYIFLSSLNLESVYFSDPFVAFWVKAIASLLEIASFNAKKYFYVPHLILVYILSCYLLPRIVSSSNGPIKGVGSRFDTLLYSVFLVFGLFLLDNTGVVFFDILPLLILLYSVLIFPNGMPKLSLRSFFLVLISFLAFFSFIINAGPLAFLYVLLIYPIALVRYSSFKNYSLVVMFCISFFTTAYFSKESIVFDYPRDAVLTPLSSLVHLGNAIIGQDRVPFPVNAHNYFYSRTATLWTLLILIIPGMVFGLYSFLRQYFRDSYLCIGVYVVPFFLVSFFLLSITLLSSLVTPSFYIDTPEAVFYRVIPGLIWRPYPTFLAALIYFFFVFLLFQYLSASNKRTVMVIGILAASFLDSDMKLEGETYAGHSLVKGGSSLRDFSVQDRRSALSISPSNYLLQAYGSGLAVLKLDDHVSKELTRIPSLESLSCYGVASRNSDDVAFAFDGSYTSRWSTKGPQNEGDWFEIRCKEPISPRQVILSAVHNPSDFPRGIKVDIFNKEESSTIIELREWFGPVQFTESGFPYFGPQSRVLLDFPEKVTTNKMRFTLTKGDSNFDWTIAEIIVME